MCAAPTHMRKHARINVHVHVVVQAHHRDPQMPLSSDRRRPLTATLAHRTIVVVELVYDNEAALFLVHRL